MSRSNDYIPVAVRQQVALRSSYSCEYCLLPEVDSYFGYEIDHIISLKHGGGNQEKNLAYACLHCNRNKGTDLGSIDWATGNLARFFNPRTDIWAEHFRLNRGIIDFLTVIGKVTIAIFKLNDGERPTERTAYQSDN
jgi:hypothetical protein